VPDWHLPPELLQVGIAGRAYVGAAPGFPASVQFRRHGVADLKPFRDALPVSSCRSLAGLEDFAELVDQLTAAELPRVGMRASLRG
jgi:hypothetical protein